MCFIADEMSCGLAAQRWLPSCFGIGTLLARSNVFGLIAHLRDVCIDATHRNQQMTRIARIGECYT
jgi:hypothetical protein